MASCRRPGEDLDLILSFDLTACIFSSSSVRLVEAADNSLRTKGDALPSCYDIGLLSSNHIAPTMSPTYPTSSNAYTTYFVPGYCISRHIMFTVWLILLQSFS